MLVPIVMAFIVLYLIVDVSSGSASW